MLERAIESLLGRYFFDDGVVAAVGIFSSRAEVEILASAPILPGHPDYSQARMNSNYKRGRVYSAEDWRDLRLLLGGVEHCEARLGAEPLAGGLIQKMPYELDIDSFEVRPLAPSVASLVLTAESLSLSCRFRSLGFGDSALKSP